MNLANKICSKCVLPDSFPGIRFNEEGVCNFCMNYKGKEYLQEKKSEYSNKFDNLVAKYRGRSSYDVLMCYSGGKDSTYTLSIFKEKYSI